MITESERTNAYARASDSIKELYGSLETARLIKNVRMKFNLGNDRVVDVIGDITLGLYPKHMLMSLLNEQLGVSWKIAADIASELGHLLDAIPDNPGTQSEEREAVAPRVEGYALPEPQAAPVRTIPQAPIIPPIERAPSPTTTPAPQPPQTTRPLTRDELMQALERKQQVGGNLDAIRQKLAEAASQPVVGYDALPNREDRTL